MSSALITIPNEIFDQIISYLLPTTQEPLPLPSYTTTFHLRLVCKELNHRILVRHGSWHFGSIGGEFTQVGMRKVVQRAQCPAARMFRPIIHIQMTTKGRVLGPRQTPGWERNELGYIANPDAIYEVRALKNLNRIPLWLRYDIHQNVEEERQHEASLKETIESILAICAAARLSLSGVDLREGSLINNKIAASPTPRGPIPQWDMSKPLLDAACALIPALDIYMEPETKDLEWVESFLVKCSNLKQLYVRFLSRKYKPPSRVPVDRSMPHRFFDDIAAWPALLPPVELLTLERNGFKPTELVKFVGRFKDTLRSIQLYEISLNDEEDGDGGWAMFLSWLRENVPKLEQFGFEVLRQGPGETAKAVSFGLMGNSPHGKFTPNPRRPRVAHGKVADGILGMSTLDAVCEDLSIYRVKFGQSICGTQEALRWLAQMATPRVPPDGYTRMPLLFSNRISP